MWRGVARRGAARRVLLVRAPRQFRGDKASAKAPHDFLLPKTLKLKKKSGGHLRPVIFGSGRLPNWNFCVFLSAPTNNLGINLNMLKLINSYILIHHFKAFFM